MKLEHKLFELKDFAVQMAKLRNEKHFDFLVTIVERISVRKDSDVYIFLRIQRIMSALV